MRFRLLSYVAAILLLAGVLGANLTPRTTTDIRAPNRPPLYSGDPRCEMGAVYVEYITHREACFGWPITAVIADYERSIDFRYGDLRYEPFIPVQRTWYYPAFALDIAICLAISIAGLLACEFVLRRYSPKPKN